ncbi:hypothetical protein Q5M85_06425 [Paraclostridium bifermentans]|nr:hypothetical protein [Paraclostridium bifermentans]
MGDDNPYAKESKGILKKEIPYEAEVELFIFEDLEKQTRYEK